MHAIDYTLANAKGKLVKVINDLLSPAMVATEAREPAEPAAKGQELQSKWCHECQGIPLQWLGMRRMHDILFNDWIADLFLQHSSTIQHVSTVYEYFLSIMSCEIRWYVDISMWHATGHGTFLTPRGHHQAALLAMSRPSRPVAKAAQESTAGAMTQMLHICSIGVIVNYGWWWLVGEIWFDDVWYCNILYI